MSNKSHKTPSPHTTGQFDTKSICIRYLPVNILESEILALFARFGKMKFVKIVSDLSKKEYPPPYAMAFVTYEDELSATNAIAEWNGVMYGERKLVCTRSRTPTRAVEKWFPVVDLATVQPIYPGEYRLAKPTVVNARLKSPNVEEELLTLYFRPLPMDVTDKELRALCAPFGGVKDVIITDKGFDVQNKIAFVKFDTHENGAKALKALKALQWRNDPSYPHVNVSFHESPVQRKARKLDEYEKKLRQANAGSNAPNTNTNANANSNDPPNQQNQQLQGSNNGSLSFSSQAYPGLPHSSNLIGSTILTGKPNSNPQQQSQQSNPSGNVKSHKPTYRAGQSVPSISLLSPNNNQSPSQQPNNTNSSSASPSGNAQQQSQQSSLPSPNSNNLSFSQAPTYAQSLSLGLAGTSALSSAATPHANNGSSASNNNSLVQNGSNNNTGSHTSPYASKRGNQSNQQQHQSTQIQRQSKPVQSQPIQQPRQQQNNNQRQQNNSTNKHATSNLHNHFYTHSSAGSVNSTLESFTTSDDSLPSSPGRSGKSSTQPYMDMWSYDGASDDEDNSAAFGDASFIAAPDSDFEEDSPRDSHGAPNSHRTFATQPIQPALTSPTFQPLTAQRYIAPPHTYGLPPLSANSFYTPPNSVPVSSSASSAGVAFRPIGEERPKQVSVPSAIGEPSSVSGSHMKDLFSMGSSQLASLGGTPQPNTGANSFSKAVGSEKFYLSSNPPFNTSPHSTPFSLTPSNSSSALNTLISNPNTNISNSTANNQASANIPIPPHIPSPHPSDMSILAQLGACQDLLLDCESGLFSLDHILTLKPDFLVRKGIANHSRVLLVQNLRTLGAKNDFILDCLEIPWSLTDVLQMDNQSLMRKGMDLDMVVKLREKYLF